MNVREVLLGRANQSPPRISNVLSGILTGGVALVANGT